LRLVVIQDGARYHTSKAMQQFFDTHADRLTIEQLPAYSPDFNPIEYLWKKIEKEATHLKHFSEFSKLQEKVDRVKDMIISGGENVYSAEVENAIYAHPAVAECAVIGVPDEKWGERVHAIVRCAEGEASAAEALMAHCHKLIAGYKCPRSVEFVTAPLPLSGAGKILKTELRKPYWQDQELRPDQWPRTSFLAPPALEPDQRDGAWRGKNGFVATMGA
jgi:hypothetical protein